MDKYEYRVKTEQMQDRVADKDYVTAMRIADTIDWRRVKNAETLCFVSEIYEYNNQFGKARNILFIAYDHAPENRKIIYRLGILALKLGDTVEAMDCYEEFLIVAPKDPNQYILRYKILKAEGASYAQQIEALERFKKIEYVEKWAYELAVLYHESGMATECLAECDDLILWFNDGRHVFDAMELKLKYKKLTQAQQSKYEQYARKYGIASTTAPVLNAIKPIVKSVEPVKVSIEEAIIADKSEVVEVIEDTAYGMTTVINEEELQAIRDAVEVNADEGSEISENKTVRIDVNAVEQELEASANYAASPMPSIVPTEGRSRIDKADAGVTGQLRLEEILMGWEQKQKEMELAINHEREKEEQKAAAEMLLKAQEEARLQEELLKAQEEQAEDVEEEPILPEDIRQLMEDIENGVESKFIIDDDERERRDMEPVENKGSIVEDLSVSFEDDLSDLDEDIEDEYEEEYEDDFSELDEDEEEIEDGYEEEYQDEFAELDEDEEEIEDGYEEEYQDEFSELDEDEEEIEDEYEEEYQDEFSELDEDEEEIEDEYEEEYQDEFSELEEDEEEIEDEYEEEYQDEFSELDEDEEEIEDEHEEEYQDEFSEWDDQDNIDSDQEEENWDSDYEDEVSTFYETQYDDDEFEVYNPEEDDEEEELKVLSEERVAPSRIEMAKAVATGKTAKLPTAEIARAVAAGNKIGQDTGFIVQARYDLDTQSEIGLRAGLTEEQKKLFSYFVPVRGMSEQLVDVLESDKHCTDRGGTSNTGNLLVIGSKGSGKTVLAVDVVKAIQRNRNINQGKVAIITGEALNKKKISEIMGKLYGGALIIEKANGMKEKTVLRLNKALERDTGEMLIVLEDERKPLDTLLASNMDFRKKFTSRLEVPVFINDELVTFGQAYAKESEYRIDEMGILALYSRIDALQREDHPVTVAEVKAIVDEAIDRSKKIGIKSLTKKIFGKSGDGDGRIILSEKHFNL